MDRRSYRRQEVHGDVRGKMILAENLDIIDLSLSGIRFNCLRRVDMNSIRRIQIRKDKVSLSLKGKVIRSTLKKIERPGEERNAVYYEVAMIFRDLSDDDKRFLEQLIGLIKNG